MCHPRLCRRPGLCNLGKQESRLRERGCRGGGEGTGGCPASPFPGGAGTGYLLHPADLPGPTVGPVPPRPGWPQDTSAGAERAWRWCGLSAHGERAGEERERRTGSKPQFWPEKVCKKPSKEPSCHSPARWGGWLCHGCGKDPRGSGPEPDRAQLNRAVLRLPGTSVGRGINVLSCERESPVPGRNGAVDLGPGTPQLQAGGEGRRLKANLANRVLGDRQK